MKKLLLLSCTYFSWVGAQSVANQHDIDACNQGNIVNCVNACYANDTNSCQKIKTFKSYNDFIVENYQTSCWETYSQSPNQAQQCQNIYAAVFQALNGKSIYVGQLEKRYGNDIIECQRSNGMPNSYECPNNITLGYVNWGKLSSVQQQAIQEFIEKYRERFNFFIDNNHNLYANVGSNYFVNISPSASASSGLNTCVYQCNQLGYNRFFGGCQQICENTQLASEIKFRFEQMKRVEQQNPS